MKLNDSYLILLVGLGAAAYLMKTPAKTTTPTKTPAASGPQEIRVDGDAHGWRYFTDGTAIDPYGTYYKDGLPVWNPMM
ncbi:hypothetical protein [Pseudoduganella aquatica]|uniref:hypothetical protein n=1 Tax=Pseudoduganella aquatica TaxID=2660641 RepID=UPI001E4E6451|nr:hypothetical protein [Pseudoduganella aquatica]